VAGIFPLEHSQQVTAPFWKNCSIEGTTMQVEVQKDDGQSPIGSSSVSRTPILLNVCPSHTLVQFPAATPEEYERFLRRIAPQKSRLRLICEILREHCEAQGSCVLTRAGCHECIRRPWKASELPGYNAVDDIDAASFSQSTSWASTVTPHPPRPAGDQGVHRSRKRLRNLQRIKRIWSKSREVRARPNTDTVWAEESPTIYDRGRFLSIPRGHHSPHQVLR